MRYLSRSKALAAACLAVLLSSAGAARGEDVLIKMATLAPEGSPWLSILKDMGTQWKSLSGGQVSLRIYPGGVAGDDKDAVRKMRLGTLQGGSLSSAGLSEIDSSVLALQVPMMFDSYEEFDAVLAKMAPQLERSFLDKGFVVLHWADAGWVHFFTKAPVRTPDDLKPMKLFVWGSENSVVEIWKAAGFNPVPLPSTEISTALQTGLVNAVPTTPQAAVLLQWYNYAKNMTDVRWGVLLAATVVSRATWEKIPAAVRPALLEVARKSGQRLRDEIRRGEARDVEAMKKRGLNVVHVDATADKLWTRAAESAYPKVRGAYAPADAFAEALSFRDAYRRKAAAGR